MTSLIPTLGFSWSGSDLKASISLTNEHYDFLGGKDAEVHLAVVGRQMRIVAGRRPSGRSCTMSRQLKSKNWPWRVLQKLEGDLAGYTQGLTVFECERIEDGSNRWIQFDIPSNLIVSDDPKGLPTEPDLIMKDLASRADNARKHDLKVRLSVVKTRVVTEEVEL